MELPGARVVVLGLGRSGVAAARLLAARGARVVGADDRSDVSLGDDAPRFAELVLGDHRRTGFAGVELVVVSPGFPGSPWLAEAETRGIPVVGETELAFRFLDAPVVAIGGTNGKSTVTTLVGEMARSGLDRVFVGGNLGTPACEAPFGSWDLVVLEVSSFQMERVEQFRPRVAALLNVSPDHLDRYPDFAAYAAAKGNAFVRQGPDDYAVVPVDDAVTGEQAARGRGRRVTFGGCGADYVLEGRRIEERATGQWFDLTGAQLFGAHNLANGAAAVAVARCAGLDRGAVEQGLARFRPLPHRMVRVGELCGVRFYDDSKGTNVGAAVAALSGLEEERAVLIAGGRDKLGSYAPLVEALERRGRAVVVIGEAAARLAEAIGDRLPVRVAAGLEEATRLAFESARPGDAVLLSPACSSFDMFRSYAERGERFTEAVASLIQGLAEHPEPGGAP